MKTTSSYILVFLFFCSYEFVSGQTSPTSGGPDAYGYRWKSSQSTDSDKPIAKWVDLQNDPRYSSRIDISDRLDAETIFGPLNFSFDFPYYWYKRNKLYVGTNGFIAFEQNNISATFEDIPKIGGQCDDYMAVFLADLNMSNSAGDNTGRVYYYTDFKDTAIVSWVNVPAYNPTNNGVPGSNQFTFQVILCRNGTITYQYAQKDGPPNQNSSASNYLVIGIENVSGQVGLQQSQDDITQFPPLMSQSSPFAIRFYPPADSKFSTKDLAVEWNNSEGSKGFFVTKKGKAPLLSSAIINQGISTSAAPSSSVTGSLYKGNIKVTSQTGKTPNLNNGESFIQTFNTLKVPNTNEEVYEFKTTLSWKDDKIQTNNSTSQEIKVIDTTQIPISLAYENEGGVSGSYWVVTTPFFGGWGKYIEPPFYPITITGINAFLSGQGQARIILRDDNGKDLFGLPDGSPGDTLYTEDLILPNAGGYENVALADPIQINSGGVYVCMMQGNPEMAMGLSTQGPFSYRSYEVFNGIFTPYRSRKVQDVMLNLEAEKGSIDNAEDLVLAEIISPKETDTITTAKEVSIVIHNAGKKAFNAPVNVSYKIDSRNVVIEQIPVGTVINPGADFTYTFQKKADPPAQPNTNYRSFCSSVLNSNDLTPFNNSICYGEVLQVENKEIINNFFLYPNPAKDKLNLIYSITEHVELFFEVYDLNGKQVMHTNLGEKQMGFYTQSFDISTLSKGFYFARLVSNKGAKSFRVIVD